MARFLPSVRCLLALLLPFLASAAHATVWSFPGNLPATCSGSAGSYTCSSLSLAWGDSLTISTATTITVSGSVSVSGNNINYPTSAATLNLVLNSPSSVALGGNVNINGNITTKSALALSNADMVNGNIVSGGALSTQANTITGNVTVAGAATIGWGTTINGALTAVTLSDGGNCTYGTSSTPAATTTITLTGTGGSSLGSASVVHGSLVGVGNLTISSTTIQGNVTVGGTVSNGWGATVTGVLTAAVLNDQGGNVYGTASTPASTTTVVLTGSGASSLNTYSVIYGSMTTQGSLSGGDDAIYGNLQVNGALSTSYQLIVTGTVNAASLSDGGYSSFGGAVTVTGNASLGYGTYLGSSLTVGGALALGNGGGQVRGAVTVGGALTTTNWGIWVGGNVVAASFSDNSCGGTYSGNITVSGGTLNLCSTVYGSVINTASSGGVINVNVNSSVSGCVQTNTTAADSINVNMWNANVGAVCCDTGTQCLPTSSQCYAVGWWFGNDNTSLCSLGAGATPASFNAVASGAASTSSHLYTQLVNSAFTLDIYALNSNGSTTTAFTKPVKVELVNAGSGSCATSGSVCQGYANISTVTASTAMTSGKITALPVPAVGNAYKDVCVRVTSTTNTSQVNCSVGNFTIRPQTLSVSAYTSGGVTALASSAGGATATPTVTASSTFVLSASSGASNYTGTPSVNIANITDYLGSAIPMSTLWGGSFNAASNGVATGSFTYGEVGYFTLGANAVVDSTYTAGSNNQSNGDCVANSTSNTASSGLYGCNIGSAASGSWGRFVPAHFVLASGSAAPALINRADIAACSASAFTYMGEDFKTTFTLVAQNANNQTTTNYAGAYARLSPLTSYSGYGFAAGAGTLAQGMTAAPSGSWSAGQAAITAYHQLTRSATTPSAPYANNAITLTPVDSDGVTSAAALALGSTNFYYGRLQLSSFGGALGSSLQLPLRAYYWSGSTGNWISNGADSCSVIPVASVALSNYLSGVGATTTSWSTSATVNALSAGVGSIQLAAPTSLGGSTVRPGSVSVALNLGSGTADVACVGSHPATSGAALAYLRSQNGCQSTYSADPGATATFGIYSAESNKTMYIRELY